MPVLSLVHLFSLVPMMSVPAPAVSMPVTYQMVAYLLCLLVLDSPLVQDFAGATSSAASLAPSGCAAEPQDPWAAQHVLVLPQTAELRLVLGLAPRIPSAPVYSLALMLF